jgi:hypothetical protein
MARHCDIRLAEAIERDVLALWERATPVSVFLKKRNWDLPDDIEDEIREDIDSVETLSDFQKSEESGSG